MRQVLLTTALVLASAVVAQAEGELSGFLATDVRVFPESPAFPEQRDAVVAPSLLVQPEYRHAWRRGTDRLTIVPFARLDLVDDERTHADLRELSWLHVGERWDLMVGVGKLFWGVAESRHLVDIVNQTDLVEDPNGEDKLGQPMARLALLREWGVLTFFLLPRFRERTFPGPEGRLRGAIPVAPDRASFESSLAEWHPDGAVRWTHVLGDWDVGLAHFSGTSREPRLVPGEDGAGRVVLIPHYDLIHQTGLDVQYTTGAWLGKLETITRAGHGDPFVALVTGVEYTFFGVFDTVADVGLLAEYLYDGRDDDDAPATSFDDDIFVALRLALNDPQDTNLLASATVDRKTGATVLSVEAGRRLGDRWTIELEGVAFVDIPFSDPLFGIRRDHFVQLRLAWFF